MNALLVWNGGEWWHVAGWTMLHFLWLGALVGLAAGACRFVLRRADANTRYAAALASLAVLAALPVGIAAWLAAKPQAMHADVAEIESASRGIVPTAPVAGGSVASRNAPLTIAQTVNPRPSRGLADVDASPMSAPPLAVFALDATARHLPWLWLVGTPLTFVFLATGVIGAERLRRASCPIKNGPIAETAARLAAALRISRQVSLAVCERIAAPVLVGIVRPIVLLPPAALTGWSPEEIEMVLLHELAHVRRWDNLVNLMQRCIESLLFFHPAVWLASNWVRREREACCDAVVVGRTNRPHAYAELLVALAAQMPRSVLFHPSAASAMSAGPLRGRIRRILKLEDDPMLISGKSLGIVMSSLLLAATLIILNLPSRSRAEESADAEKKKLTTEDTETTEGKQESPMNLQSKLSEIRDHRQANETGPNDVTGGGVSGARRLGLGSSTPVQLNEEEGQRIVGALKKNPAVQSASIRRTPEGYQALYVNITEPPGKKAFLAWDTDADGRLTCSLKFIDLPSKQADDGQAKESATVGTGSTETRQQDRDVRRVTLAISDKQTATAESERGRLRLQIRTTDGESSKFPSLEDQKLADLIWNRMRGLELEPIGEEDLKRVKALGYEGGLKNTSSTSSSIQPGDILVGLHVWPTTSLQQVVDILNRDDLAELNPLKFYVVRPGAGKNQTGGFHQPEEDRLITGRIPVNLPERASQSTPAKPRPVVAAGPDDNQKLQTEPPTGTSADRDKSSLRYDGKTFDEWRNIWRTELSTEKRLEIVKALAAFGANGYGKEAAEAILDIAGQYEWMVLGDNRGIVPLQNACLTAFGGYAAVAVNNEGVVAQRLPKQDALPVLLNAVKSDNRQIRLFLRWVLPDYDNPQAIDALLTLSRDRDPQVSFSAVNALPAIDGTNPNAKLVERIREGLAGDSPDAEVYLRKLSPGWSNQPGTPQPGKYLYYLPEFYPKLFSEHEHVRRQARQELRWIAPTDATTLAGRLIEVLQDEARSDQHLEAIRALGMLGPQAKPVAVEPLRTILAGDNDESRVAAAAALESILDPKEYGRLLTETIGDELGLSIDSTGTILIMDRDRNEEFERQVMEERRSRSLTQ